jgi:hypothetical protein
MILLVHVSGFLERKTGRAGQDIRRPEGTAAPPAWNSQSVPQTNGKSGATIRARIRALCRHLRRRGPDGAVLGPELDRLYQMKTMATPVRLFLDAWPTSIINGPNQGTVEVDPSW